MFCDGFEGGLRLSFVWDMAEEDAMPEWERRFPKLWLSHVFFLSFLALRAVLAPSCGSNISGM